MAITPEQLKKLRTAKRELNAKIRLAEKMAGGSVVDAAKAKSHSEQVARRLREKSAIDSEVGPIPDVVDPERKERCRLNLFAFLTTYFPLSTGKSPFSEDHHRVVAEMQDCIINGGRRVNAVFRGFGKTTIAENTTLWALLYGHRRFAIIAGINIGASTRNVNSIKRELSLNELLYEDFPEVCKYFGIAQMNVIGLRDELDNLKELESAFFLELLKSGFIIKRGAYNFVSYAHTEKHIDDCLTAIDF